MYESRLKQTLSEVYARAGRHAVLAVPWLIDGRDPAGATYAHWEILPKPQIVATKDEAVAAAEALVAAQPAPGEWFVLAQR